MKQLIFSLFMIVGGLIIGKLVHVKTKDKEKNVIEKTNKVMFLIRNIAFFGIVPYVSVNAFWILDFKNISIISVPFIGLGAMILGSLAALILSKLFKHDTREKGAMFCCGSSSNIGSIGALICFAFLGEAGFAFCALYKLLEAPYLYLIVYPSAKKFSVEKNKSTNKWYVQLIKDPIIIVYFSTIIIGLILNFGEVARPSIFEKLSSIFVPLGSFMLIVSIGYTMRFNKIANYKKEVIGITAIKYLMTPIFIVSVSYALGLHTVEDGVLFKSLVILSALPCGFNSIISSQMYKLDTNLANSCWIVTTSLLMVAVPVVWLFAL